MSGIEKVGTENFKVKDHPFYVPKENMKFLMNMEKIKASREISTFKGQPYPSEHKKTN